MTGAPPPGERRPLGRTGLDVFPVGLGTWGLAPGAALRSRPAGYGPIDEATAERVVERALELGVDFFDTAPTYGNGAAETLLGRVLGARAAPERARLVVATKVGRRRRDPAPPVRDLTASGMRRSIEESLARLRRDRIDVLLLHDPPPDIASRDEVFDTLEALRREGLFRVLGASVERVEDGIALLRAGRVEALEVELHALRPEAETALLPLARERGAGVIVKSPLGHGVLSGRLPASRRFPPTDHRHLKLSGYRLRDAVERAEALRPWLEAPGRTFLHGALAYALGAEAVSVAIPGARTSAHIEEAVETLAAAARSPPVDRRAVIDLARAGHGLPRQAARRARWLLSKLYRTVRYRLGI